MPVGIVGLGLIGGSIGLSLMGNEAVWGYDLDPAVSHEAESREVISHSVGSMDLLNKCDVIFVAVHPAAAAETIKAVLAACPHSIVSDCTGFKGEIVKALAGVEGESRFVPGHPMAGKEVGGLKNASAQLFRNARWVLTPSAVTDSASVATVSEVIAEMGAEPVQMSAEDHDWRVGLVSHLPHVLAHALCHLDPDGVAAQVSAGSWKDVTRVAASPPEMWVRLCQGNAGALTAWIDALVGELQAVSGSLKDGDELLIERFFMKTQEAIEEMRGS